MSWPLVRLDECARIVGGATPATSNPAYWDGNINWVTPKDLSDLPGPYIAKTPRRITAAGLAACAAEVLPPNSVLFSSRAPIGHVAINVSPMATNQGFKSFVPDPRKVEAGYLYWWLRCHRSLMEGLGNGATFKEVSKAVVSRVTIPLPPIEEQRRITAILHQAENLRRLRRASINRVEHLVSSIFAAHFSTRETPHQTVPLSELADIQIGHPFESSIYTNEPSGIRLCRGANVLPGRLDWSDLARWPEDKAAPHSHLLLRSGDIIIAMDRPWISGGFKIAQVVPADIPALLVQRVARIRASSEDLGLFLYHSLRQPEFARHCKPTETTVPHISPKEIRNYRISRPPTDKLKSFSAEVRALAAYENIQVAQMTRLDALFSSLQHRAFSGGFTVKAVQRELAEAG